MQLMVPRRITVGLALLAWQGHGQPAQAADRETCARGREQVVRQSDYVQIVRSRSRVFSCWLPTHRRTRLRDNPSRFALNGSRVGLLATVSTPRGNRLFVRSVDARRGRIVNGSDAYFGQGDTGLEARLKKLEVSAVGDLAWTITIADLSTDEKRTQVYVRRASLLPRAQPMPVDPGPDVIPGSLATVGDYVYWLNAGAARFARFSSVSPDQ